jgi:hypothetical protein
MGGPIKWHDIRSKTRQGHNLKESISTWQTYNLIMKEKKKSLLFEQDIIQVRHKMEKEYKGHNFC